MIDAQILAARKLGIRFHAIRGSLSTGEDRGATHVVSSLVEPLDKIVKDTVRPVSYTHLDVYKRQVLLRLWNV